MVGSLKRRLDGGDVFGPEDLVASQQLLDSTRDAARALSLDSIRIVPNKGLLIGVDDKGDDPFIRELAPNCVGHYLAQDVTFGGHPLPDVAYASASVLESQNPVARRQNP